MTEIISIEVMIRKTIQGGGGGNPGNATKNEHICSMCIKINSRQTGSRNPMGSKNASHDMGYLYEACDQISDLCHQ